MQLPGKLSLSTLGDLLGALHRGRTSGVLALRETRGLSAGRRHHIHLRSGLVVGVETPDSSAPPATEPEQVRRRLDSLFALSEAELTFQVARGPHASGRPLSPAEFLHGRPRQRDRAAGTSGAGRPAAGRPRAADAPRAAAPPSAAEQQALAALGLPASASAGEVRQAFRRLALALHPDRHPTAPEGRRRELARQFAGVVSAYRVLSGGVG